MEGTIHIVGPSQNHTHTIIFLHGRDSTASEFADEFFRSQASDDLTLPEIFPTVKWVFPSSKLRMWKRFEIEMPQWFDMWSVENPSEKNEIQIDGLRESIKEILSIVHNEALLIPPERIILGGISQGCATAIHALICGGIRLGGFIGLCSWLPFQDKIATIAKTAAKNDISKQMRSIFDSTGENQKALRDLSDLSKTSALETPIFLSHSKDDEVVPVDNGMELYKSLENLGLAVTWKCYKHGGHWVNEPQGIDDMVEFLRNKSGVGITEMSQHYLSST